MGNPFGRSVIIPLTNKSGGGVIAGDVVVVDTTNNDAFTTSTAGAFTGGVGVAQQTIASNAVGLVALSGYVALVNTSASVTRGNFGKTHTVAKQAVDAGASRGVGTFCQFLTGGTTPDAMVYPVDLLGSSLTNPMTTAQDVIVGGSSGTPGRLAIGAAGGALVSLNSVVAYNSGTSMPGAKATGDRYWRTDLGMEFYWDGTRWVSTTLFDVKIGDYSTFSVAGGGGGTVNVAQGRMPPLGLSGTDLWLVDARWTYNVASAHSSSNYWTVLVQKYDNSSSPTLATLVTDKSTTTWNNPTPTAIGAALGTTNTLIYLSWTMTGTTGTFGAGVNLRYRMIGT